MKKIEAKLAIALIGFAILGSPGRAQVAMEDGHAVCAMAKPSKHEQFAFRADKDAIRAVERILDHVGLPSNFSVMSCNVDNVLARTEQGQRYILYNHEFMARLKSFPNDWALVSSLAHEVGHHLANHTLSDTSSDAKVELQADFFSGHVLQKMGAPLAEAKNVIETFATSEVATPGLSKEARLNAITSGWIAARDLEPLPEQVPGIAEIVPVALSSAPPTVELYAENDIVSSGESTTLRWSSTHATSVRLNGRRVGREGTKTVRPRTTSDYEIEAIGPGGVETDSVTVDVRLFCTVYAPPSITHAGSNRIYVDGDHVGTMTFNNWGVNEVTFDCDEGSYRFQFHVNIVGVGSDSCGGRVSIGQSTTRFTAVFVFYPGRGWDCRLVPT